MSKNESKFLVIGILLGLTVPFYGTGARALLSAIIPPPAPLIRCPADIDTGRWLTYTNAAMAIELRHPPSYTVAESQTGITLVKAGTNDRITLEKIRGALAPLLSDEMRLAGWKVADRQVYALTTPYFSDRRGTLSETYLFVRDFPRRGGDGPFVMIRATLTTDRKDSALLAAHAAGILDSETILTEGEQVLSTFRFLQFTELP